MRLRRRRGARLVIYFRKYNIVGCLAEQRFLSRSNKHTKIHLIYSIHLFPYQVVPSKTLLIANTFPRVGVPFSAPADLPPVVDAPAHRSPVFCVAFSPDRLKVLDALISMNLMPAREVKITPTPDSKPKANDGTVPRVGQ